MANALNRPNNVERVVIKTGGRKVSFQKLHPFGNLSPPSQLFSRPNLFGAQSNSDHLNGIIFHQPNRTPTDTTAGIQNQIALFKINPLRQETIGVNQRRPKIGGISVPQTVMHRQILPSRPKPTVISLVVIVIVNYLFSGNHR